MLKVCQESNCGRAYDDARRSTVCPHEELPGPGPTIRSGEVNCVAGNVALDFGEALAALKNDAKITRHKWQPEKGQVLSLTGTRHGLRIMHPSPQGGLAEWHPMQDDLLACDWRIVEEAPS